MPKNENSQPIKKTLWWPSWPSKLSWSSYPYFCAPENIFMVLLICTGFWQQKFIKEHLSLTNTPHFWGPIVGGVVTHTVFSFFGNLREAKELNHHKKIDSITYLRRECDREFDLVAKNKFVGKKYYDAAMHYGRAAELFKKIYGSDILQEEGVEQLKLALYRQAFSLYWNGDLTEAVEIITNNTTLAKDKDSLNLGGLIKMRLRDFEQAKKYFDDSLKIDKAQNCIYILSLFVKKDYKRVISHSSFENGLGHIPLAHDEKFLVTFELLQVLAESHMELKNYKEAFRFFEAALRN